LVAGYFLLQIAGTGFPMHDSPYDPPGVPWATEETGAGSARVGEPAERKGAATRESPAVVDNGRAVRQGE
jgi:hypothetical protein